MLPMRIGVKAKIFIFIRFPYKICGAFNVNVDGEFLNYDAHVLYLVRYFVMKL